MLSLRVRLLAGLVALVVLGMAVTAAATYKFLENFLTSDVDTNLAASVEPAADQLSGFGFRGGPTPANMVAGTYLELRASDGSSVLGHGIVHYFDSPIRARPVLPGSAAPNGYDHPTFSTIPGRNGVAHYRLVVERLDRPGMAGEVILIATPMTDVDQTLQRLLLIEVSISTVVVVAMLAFAWLIVRTGLRPLDRMGATAEAIAAGDLGRRVEPATPKTEIGRLGLALNRMLGQIEGAFAERTRSEQRLRRFIADASHELRTPLTSIRGYAELLRRGAAHKPEDAELARRRIEQESIRMSDLVEDMLLLARLDQGRPLEREAVDLTQLAHDAVHDARVVASQRSIGLNAPTRVIVVGDDQRLRQVVGNLVRNAIVHTPTPTPVEVEVSAGEGHATLSVVDHGPGLDPELVSRVFEPFFRADAGRSRDRGGSGLGLSIVAAVVAAHAGTVNVTRTPGGGATFTVELPLAAEQVAPDEHPVSATG